MLAGGCVWTSDGGLTQRYVSDWQGTAESEPGSWAGEPIIVQGDSGGLVLVGVPGKQNITAHAYLSAGARNPEDAEAAFVDVAESLSIELRDGTWWVQCNEAQADHGSAVSSSTGCDEMVVELPAGSEGMPISVWANTDFGGIHASGLVVEDLDLRAPFGLVADVEPVGGATLRLWGESLVSGMCSSWLRVPEATGFEALSLEVQRPDLRYNGVDPNDPQWWLQVEVRGMPDAPPTEPFQGSLEWEREQAEGALVQSATVRASLGKAILTTGEVPAADTLTLCASRDLEGWSTADSSG